MAMKISRPAWIFLSLVMVLLILLSLVIVMWRVTDREDHLAIETVSMLYTDAYTQFLTSIRETSKLLLPITLASQKLARILNASLNASLSSFPTIEFEVARYLFLVLSTLPNMSQVSYIGEDGLFFSYYKEQNQMFAVFANASYTNLNDPDTYRWYVRPVSNETGLQSAEATDSTPLRLTNSSWFNDALNNENGYSMLGLGWGEVQELLFLSMAPIKDSRGRRGLVSLGLPLTILSDFLSEMHLNGAAAQITTKDGHLLAQAGPPDTGIVFSNGSVFIRVRKSSNSSAEDAELNISSQLDATSEGLKSSIISSTVRISDTRYEVYCAPLYIVGIESEFAAAVDRISRIALALLILMFAIAAVTTVFFVFMLCKAERKQIFLSSTLVKQMEAAKQAERKSKNKGLAFARANHDVRTSLAAIIGLIELCRTEVRPQSEMETNLVQMDTCANNLLGILNSILDTSKIEAGMMTLEEGDFDIAQVLEEAVDMFYVIASKKGVEVMLDPCDGSILKCSLVKGDCGKFKQIVCNLLSNAVKFTTRGRVVVRVWAKEPRVETSAPTQNHHGHHRSSWQNVFRLISKKENAYTDSNSGVHVPRNSNSIEFVFEVDDTGKGIPREKWNSVFDNYIQVKGSDSGNHEGTGLGLGIVQALVKLMGGDIKIVEKAHGEEGTCCRFNVFLQSCECTRETNAEGEDIRLLRDQLRSDLDQPQQISTAYGKHISISIHSQMNVGSTELGGGSRNGRIHAVLMIEWDEARHISERWLKHYGMKVWPVNYLEDLYGTVERLEQSFTSNSIRSQASNSPAHSSSGENEGNASAAVVDSLSLSQVPSRGFHKKTSLSIEPNWAVIVIDASCGPVLDICSILQKIFRNVNSARYKVAWLADPNTRRKDLSRLKAGQALCDLILQKPFHRTRVHDLLKFVHESDGTSEGQSSEITIENPTHRSPRLTQGSPSQRIDPVRSSPHGVQSRYPTQPLMGLQDRLSSERPLTGMNILLAEDNATLRKVGVAILERQGATVECCEDGEEALSKVIRALHGLSDGVLNKFPYDLILMDCEMPNMDGYQATMQIREAEQYYGLRIPIIALTAHAGSEEKSKAVHAGMDFHLVKPLKPDRLLEAIQCGITNN
ncbi:hypothetical protein ACLOJK_017658 [Asimina triloba]